MDKSARDSIPESIRPHLEQIADRLWTDRAVVMIGAGFSKNASLEYPDWSQLGDVLYEKAHGKKPSADNKAYVSLLKVAEEAEAVIGRPALDALLHNHIPDLNTEPSELHIDLLNLPWVDVLTTNYDTLLERACRKVIKRRYSPVVNPNDLPYAEKPRIIKLHGSFPSDRPFVITEEDYRCYPKHRAPFVNTVRQALLENTLCLIGFSGDDPNFLHWIGWIRDQMGPEYAQPIYLISAGSFAVAQQQLLAKRNIIVVNLTQCESSIKRDHKEALTLFFNVMTRNDPNRLDWPKSSHVSQNNSPEPSGQSITIEDMEKAVTTWRQQRLTYPGWVILPYSNRTNLFSYTKKWFDCHPPQKNADDIQLGLDIQFHHELIWRLERCLLPIFDNIAENCERMLEKYWPFASPHAGKAQGITVAVTNPDYSELNWSSIRQAWLALACGLLRYYREEGKVKDWQYLHSKLTTIAKYLSDEQIEFVRYQQYLFAIMTLDIPDAKMQLKNWQPKSSQPFWLSIRTAAMAELGQFDDLEQQAEEALFATRTKAQTETVIAPYQSLSYEAYQMVSSRLLLGSLQWANQPATLKERDQMKNHFVANWKVNTGLTDSDLTTAFAHEPLPILSAHDDWQHLEENKEKQRKNEWQNLLDTVRSINELKEAQLFSQRWDDLKAIRCDPWSELKIFELMLVKPHESINGTIENSGFDLGRRNNRHILYGDDQDRLNAYSFLRFCEDIGLPFRVRNTTMALKTAEACLLHIANHSLVWARSVLMRLGNVKTVDHLFNRKAVYKIKTEDSDHLIMEYLDALKKCRLGISMGNSFGKTNFEVRLATLLPEILSRLCCKCSLGSKKLILTFIAELYASPDKDKYQSIRNLSDRLLKSLSEVEQYQLVPDLLKVPFPENLDIRTERDYGSLMQLLDLVHKPETSVPDVQIPTDVINSLLQDANPDHPEKRKWAIASLIKLFALELLTVEQSQAFGAVLWQEVDSYGLPQNTDFYKFTFLKLPAPANVDPKSVFKNYITQQQFPIQPEGKRGYTITGGYAAIIHEIIGASQENKFWTHKDSVDLLTRVLYWWDTDKHRLATERANTPKASDIFGGSQEFHARLGRISEIISTAVGPNLRATAATKVKTDLLRLLTEMNEQGLHTLEAETACMHLFASSQDELISRIEMAISSHNKAKEIDALKAILFIMLKSKTENILSQVSILLSQFIQWCSSDSLTQGLWVAIRILQENAGHLLQSIEITVQNRLGRLIVETNPESELLPIDFNSKIQLRKVAMILASELYCYYNAQNKIQPKVLVDWQTISKSHEEFAEVKNAWKG